LKKRIWSWQRSIVLSFQTTGTTLTGTRTQDNFFFFSFGLSKKIFLVSKKKHAKFGAK
jgi:hypothetical protein